MATAMLAVAPAPAPAATTAVPTPVLAATPQFRHYNIDQGLPSSNVYTVVQDRRGTIWMGTITGLARFDGAEFKVYRHIPGDASSLASDDVSNVVADDQGRLWAGGESSGVNLYEPDTDGFRHFKHDPHRADSLAGNDIMAMTAGRNGSLWIGIYGHGVDHMTSPGHFQHLTHDPDDPHSLASNNVYALYLDGDNQLWIGTDRGLDVRAPNGTLRHVHFKGETRSPLVLEISGDASEMRIATSKGLFVIDSHGEARHLLVQGLHPTAALCSVRDHHGDLWIGSGHGLVLVHDGHLTPFPPRPLMPNGQPGQVIWKLMVDNEGGLWIATQNGGVAYLSPDWRDFSHYSHKPDDDSSLSHSHIRALAQDGHGNLWIGGGRRQLDKLDPATGAVTHHGKMLGTAPKRILSLARAGQHGLWIGTGGTLGLLDHGHLRKVDTPPHQSGYRRMISDTAGNLYVAPIGRGLYRVDRRSLHVEPLQLAFAGHEDKDMQTTDLIMHGGRLWRSSHAGLSYLAAHGRQLVPLAGVAKGQVTALAIADDDLWLTRPDGLEHYRLDGQHATLLRHIGAKAGWPGIIAYSMLVDKHGRVWLFGNAGLWRYDPVTNHFRHYGKEDGLPSPEFTSRQLARMDNGTVFAGTLGGVVGFRPAAIDDHPRKPQLEITSILVRRDGREVKLPLDTNRLHLHWNDRDLRISVHAMSYIDPRRNHYRFRLAGFDSDWVDTGTHGVRELAGLPPGSYRLEIEAAGPSGAWSRLATPLSIDVAAPPWATPWAWLIYVIAALILGWLIFATWRRRLEQRHRVQMARQQQRLAEQASDAKTRFLATLSHEIRTPMTGVMGMTELLLEGHLGTRERDHVETIRHSGELLLKLVNEALDMARIEAGHVVLETAPLDPRALIEEVSRLQSGQTRRKHLDFDVRVDDNLPARIKGDATRIKQILLNLSNNALKFTEHGGVTITATYIDGELRLGVSDTGPGITEADRQRLFERFEQADSPQREEGSGLGLAICRELVALMHGHIELDTVLGKGSRFEVRLPLPVVAIEETTQPSAIMSRDGTRSEALRLLLIEDDATIAQVIQGLMETRGHHVTHAADSLAALGEMQNHRFDALLLDMNLPGLDGCQLARMVRQREDGDRHLPIIAITARSGGNEEREAREAGMDAFLRKPVSGEQLARVLDELCTERALD